jgi:HAD superfamily hydrolase (TIGR01458 family)
MPRAFLLDLDGTLYTDAGPVPGGVAAVAAFRTGGVPFRCVTNTTTRDRAGLVARLSGYGYDIAPREIITPARAAVSRCLALGARRVAAYVPDAALPDLAGLELVRAGERAEAVIIGDLGERWHYALLQEAFSRVQEGAELIALSRDRYFHKGGRLMLDAGPFVAAIEFATGRTATVVGKPTAEFYATAVESLGLAPDIDRRDIVMVGDDLWSDVQGAQRAGLTAWLVRTGKFREETLRDSGIVPERVVESVAEVAREE